MGAGAVRGIVVMYSLSNVLIGEGAEMIGLLGLEYDRLGDGLDGADLVCAPVEKM